MKLILLVPLLSLGLALFAPPAGAQPPAPARAPAPATPPAPAPVYVVDVASDATELDAAQLRADLARELHADVVAPGDPRTAKARGTIAVSVDRAARQLVVAYDGKPEAITRKVDLPPDREGASRAVVLLAGNLARDEAGDLLAQLRKPDETPPAPPAHSPDVAAQRERLEKSARDLARLKAMLDEAAAREHGNRRVVGWSLIGAGAVVAGAGAGGLVATRDPAWSTTFFLIPPFVITGVVMLATHSPLDELAASADVYQPDREQIWVDYGEAVNGLEENWRLVARREHSQRRIAGWVSLGVGVAATGIGTAVFVGSGKTSTDDVLLAQGLALGGFCLAYGAYYLLTDGPVESALHEYESVSGRIPNRTGGDLSFGLAPIPGGLAAGIGGTF